MYMYKKNTFLDMIQHQQKQQIKGKANLFQFAYPRALVKYH